MKMTCPFVTLAASLALIGCGPSKPGSQEPNSAPQSAAGDTEKSLKQRVDAAKDALMENKDQFVASADARLKELDQKISELGEHAKTLNQGSNAEAGRALEVMREKRTQLSAKFEELKQSTKETWNDVKAGFESAMADLQKAFEDAKAKFNN